MTIDEAKKMLLPELKYPLPDETIDKLLESEKMTIVFSNSGYMGKHHAILAALIELKERRERGDCR